MDSSSVLALYRGRLNYNQAAVTVNQNGNKWQVKTDIKLWVETTLVSLLVTLEQVTAC